MSDTFEFEDQSRVERLTGTLHDPAATTGDVLTVQADKSIAAQPGGGGSGGVQVVTVPVSSAQILDLANTPVVLVPGVAGNVTYVVSSTLAYLAGATPYTDNGAVILVYASPAGPVWVQMANGVGFWDQATDEVNIAPPFTGQLFASTSVDGVDTVLHVVGGPSPTDGDGTLLVTVSYFLAPTV